MSHAAEEHKPTPEAEFGIPEFSDEMVDGALKAQGVAVSLEDHIESLRKMKAESVRKIQALEQEIMELDRRIETLRTREQEIIDELNIMREARGAQRLPKVPRGDGGYTPPPPRPPRRAPGTGPAPTGGAGPTGGVPPSSAKATEGTAAEPAPTTPGAPSRLERLGIIPRTGGAGPTSGAARGPEAAPTEPRPAPTAPDAAPRLVRLGIVPPASEVQTPLTENITQKAVRFAGGLGMDHALFTFDEGKNDPTTPEQPIRFFRYDTVKYEIDSKNNVIAVNFCLLPRPEPLTQGWLRINHPRYKKESGRLNAFEAVWWAVVSSLGVTPRPSEPNTYTAQRDAGGVLSQAGRQFQMGTILFEIKIDKMLGWQIIAAGDESGFLPLPEPMPLDKQHLQDLYNDLMNIAPAAAPHKPPSAPPSPLDETEGAAPTPAQRPYRLLQKLKERALQTPIEPPQVTEDAAPAQPLDVAVEEVPAEKAPMPEDLLASLRNTTTTSAQEQALLQRFFAPKTPPPVPPAELPPTHETAPTAEELVKQKSLANVQEQSRAATAERERLAAEKEVLEKKLLNDADKGPAKAN